MRRCRRTGPSSHILEYGELELRYYAPKNVDEQVPHTRDEVYVVTSGRARSFVRAFGNRSGPGMPSSSPQEPNTASSHSPTILPSG